MPENIQGALANLDDTVRRAFAVPGPVGLALGVEGMPVVQLMDLSGPGYSTFRGRRWGLGVIGSAGPGVFAIQATCIPGIIIEGVVVSGAGAANVFTQLKYCSADVVNPVALTANAGWIDQGLLSTDSAPVRYNTAIAADSLLGNTFWHWQMVAGFQGGQMSGPLHLPNNAWMMIRVTGIVANYGMSVVGRIA